MLRVQRWSDAGTVQVLASTVQCREPKTGQQKVQHYYKNDPLCPSSYTIYLQQRFWVQIRHRITINMGQASSRCNSGYTWGLSMNIRLLLDTIKQRSAEKIQIQNIFIMCDSVTPYVQKSFVGCQNFQYIVRRTVKNLKLVLFIFQKR